MIFNIILYNYYIKIRCMHICKMFRSLFALYEKVTICIRYLRYPNNYAYSGLSFWVFFLVFVFKYTTSKNGKINAMLILKKKPLPHFSETNHFRRLLRDILSITLVAVIICLTERWPLKKEYPESFLDSRYFAKNIYRQ